VKNKMLMIIGVVVILFGGLYFAMDYKNKQVVENNENPYDNKKLHQETIDQLEDPLYQNQISPENLDKELADKEDVTVYFYSPTCVHCQKTTPVLIPIIEDLNVDMKKINLLEYDDKWDHYAIEGTPTVIHYQDGEEVDRISGEQTEKAFRDFFNENVLN